MQFMHKREYRHRDDIGVVDCSHRCNVRLMSNTDFQSYSRGGSHHYHGGHHDRPPIHIVVPEDGFWNITLALGGGSAAFRHGIEI